VEYRWRAAKIDFIIRFYLYLRKKRRENYVKERESSLDLPSTCLLVVVFRFDATLCSNLGNENSNESQIKFSRGPHLTYGQQIPHPCVERLFQDNELYYSILHRVNCWTEASFRGL